jgi:hypothetical protein
MQNPLTVLAGREPKDATVPEVPLWGRAISTVTGIAVADCEANRLPDRQNLD